MNQILEPTVTKIPVSVSTSGLWLYWSYPHISNDSYFDFKPTTPYTVTADIANVIKAGTYQCYQFASSFTAAHPYVEAEVDGALAKVWGSCTNRLPYKAGSSRIVLLGTTYFHTNFSGYAPLWGAPSSKDDDIKYTYNWSIVFNLQSVTDGGLQITAELVTYFDAAFPVANNRFTSFQSNLATALAGQQKFYFPASGTLFFWDPVLNYQGDLVASVGYNGTDSPIQGVPKRSTAKNKALKLLPPAPKGIDSKASKE